MRAVGEEIKALEARLKEIEAALEAELLQVPNLPDQSAPAGGEEDSVTMHTWGEPRHVRLPAQGPPGPGAPRAT